MRRRIDRRNLNAANTAGTQTDTETRTAAAGTGTAGTGTAATAAAVLKGVAMAKMAKPTIRKAHKIARKVAQRSGSSAVNPYAVGAAVAKKQAAKRKAARTK